MSAIAHRRV